MDDIVINKAATIERCLRRVHAVFEDDDRNIYVDQTRQDSIVLNLQRACETAIDLLCTSYGAVGSASRKRAATRSSY